MQSTSSTATVETMATQEGPVLGNYDQSPSATAVEIMVPTGDSSFQVQQHDMSGLAIQLEGSHLHHTMAPIASSVATDATYTYFPSAPKAAAEPGSIIHKLKQGTYFHKFPELFIELRLKIWNEAFKLPRTAHMRLYDIKAKNGRKTGKRGLRDISRNCTPPLLHVCQESRAEGLKKFTLCFGIKPRTFFNYAIDCVYLDSQSIPEVLRILDALSSTDRANLLRVTMKVHDWVDVDENEFRERFWKFSDLRQLELLLGDAPFDETYRNRKYTASCIKDDLRDNRKNRPAGWKVPIVVVQIIEDLQHRKVGAEITFGKY